MTWGVKEPYAQKAEVQEELVPYFYHTHTHPHTQAVTQRKEPKISLVQWKVLMAGGRRAALSTRSKIHVEDSVSAEDLVHLNDSFYVSIDMHLPFSGYKFYPLLGNKAHNSITKALH